MTIKNKNNSIEILRAIAIIFVLIAHFIIIIPDELREKYLFLLKFINAETGVDLFFVISGYLMGVTFLAKTQDTELKLRDTFVFYRKRILRLLPSAYLWAFITLLFGLYFNSKGSLLWIDNNSLINNFFSSLAFLRNFTEYIHPTHLGYYWSLSVEMQFYFFLPIAWFLLKREYFWYLIYILFLIGFVWRPGGFHWIFLRFDGLLAGLMLWKLTSVENWRDSVKYVIPENKTILQLTLIISLSLVLTIPKLFPNILTPGVYNGLISLICAYVVLIGIYKESILNNIVISKFLIFIGSISYSLYLIHLPIWIMYKEIMLKLNFSSYFYVSVAFILIIIISYLNKILIEDKFVVKNIVK
ncbi:acyltransferase family protein [Aliarcobacter butzleri]|uniref:acyltransferase family protein n=1 Tax=Aliarcobacter butzleri TaxID=28197 RepID=UPI0021B4D9C0|nr:acyltransferase [Aliarcobacter butzleri]